MGWAVGFDPNWRRDVGYAVPAICDYPGCGEEINRGLGYVCCNQEPYGGEDGCGLYFCGEHPQQCERCQAGGPPFDPTPDTAQWLLWKLADESWAEWRGLNPAEVAQAEAAVAVMVGQVLAAQRTAR